MKITLYAVTAICALLSFERASFAMLAGEIQEGETDADGFAISFPQSTSASATEPLVKYLQDLRTIGRELRAFSTHLESNPPKDFPYKFISPSEFTQAFSKIRTGVNEIALVAGYIRDTKIPLSERRFQAPTRFDTAYQNVQKGLNQIGSIFMFNDIGLVFKPGLDKDILLKGLKARLSMPISKKMGISIRDTLWEAVENRHLGTSLSASVPDPVRELPESPMPTHKSQVAQEHESLLGERPLVITAKAARPSDHPAGSDKKRQRTSPPSSQQGKPTPSRQHSSEGVGELKDLYGQVKIFKGGRVRAVTDTPRPSLRGAVLSQDDSDLMLIQLR